MKTYRYTEKQLTYGSLISALFVIVLGIVLVQGGRDTVWGILLIALGAFVEIFSIRTIIKKKRK